MAVTEKIKDVKVVLNLTKGSQTIAGCKVDASAESLHTLGTAIGDLHQEDTEKISKITEVELILA
ncbi:MAG: hypothetical protein RSF87_11545 [Cellulosilyticaceae bacterium]